jgi:archaemetzincin
MKKFLLISLFFAFLLLAILYMQHDKPVVVAIQPIGSINADQIEVVRRALDSVYHIKVIVLPAIDPLASAFVNIKMPRYRADKLIASLKSSKPDSIDYIMGLTAYDISITKRDMLGRVKEPKNLYNDFGIFGLGYEPGSSCIVSNFRLGKNVALEKERLAKICVHELGHNLGLPHCSNAKCVMASAAEKISGVDHEILGFCEKCSRLAKISRKLHL